MTGAAILFAGGFCGADQNQTATNGTLENFGRATNSSFTIVTDREILAAFTGSLEDGGASGPWQVSSDHSIVGLGLAVALGP